MIDFACKQFKLDEVIKCGLGLTKADIKLIEMFLDESEWNTTSEIAQKLGFNLSTIQRSVKRLYEKGVLLRIQENLDSGGYLFLYKIKTKVALKELIMKIVNNWVKAVEKELDQW